MADNAKPAFEFPAYTKTIHRAAYPAIDPKNNSAAGKVVLITGGGSGIGKEIAKGFVQAGAKAIAILGRRENVLKEATTALEKEGSSKILHFVADVLDKAALDRAFDATAQQVGKVDIVVNNAGYFSNLELAATTDIAEWWRGFEINVKGTLLTFQSWLPFQASNNPTFISVNSAAMHVDVMPTFSSYQTSKLAQAQVVAALQAENPGIRVFNTHPGSIASEMNEKAQLPISLDDPSLPAGFAVWLAASAPDWMKGKFLWSHWDVDELEAMRDEIVAKKELTVGLNGWPKEVAEPNVVW